MIEKSQSLRSPGTNVLIMLFSCMATRAHKNEEERVAPIEARIPVKIIEPS